MLKLSNISYIVDKKPILNNINLQIESGKFYVITGPNGSGKSMLMKIIMGIISPTSGKITFNGKDITKLKVFERAKLGISYAFQSPVHFKGITVFDILKLAGGSQLTFTEACEALATVGLCAKDYLNREVNASLSGGELKRIEIIATLLRTSPLTIFDEPEAGIDIWSFNKLIDVFKNAGSSKNKTLLVVSHQEKIFNAADEIILIENGQIKKQGSSKKLIAEITTAECSKVCPLTSGGEN